MWFCSNNNRKKAMEYVKKITATINLDNVKDAIQYPRENFNWDKIIDKKEEIIIPQIKDIDQKINILMIIPWMTVGGADKFNLDIIKRSDHNKYNFIIVTTELLLLLQNHIVILGDNNLRNMLQYMI